MFSCHSERSEESLPASKLVLYQDTTGAKKLILYHGTDLSVPI